MGGIFGGGQSTSTTAEKLAGIQLQTSSYGVVVPLAYGTSRVASNLIYYTDFTAIPHTTTQRTGKGGGGSSMSNTTYTYTAMVIAAICEGPVTAINRVWKDKEVGALSAWWQTYYAGNRPQSAWPTLTSKHPSEALAYYGTAYVAHDSLDLGESASMSNYSFEVKALLATCQDPNATSAYDAHPADIITHFLTDTNMGAGWDTSRLGDFTTGNASFKTYCTAAGLFLSPVFKEAKPAREHLQELMDATNSDPVWTSGASSMVLKIIPYGDTALSGNGATYTPNTTPIYDLTNDDFLPLEGMDPIQVERLNQAESYNIWPVEFLDRQLDYNTNIVTAPVQEDVDAFGERRKETLSLPCITRASVAQTISDIKAKRDVYCRNRYTFKLGWRYILLEPMDLVTLTEPIAGLDHKVVRIRSVEESEDGQLTVNAEEWPFGVATATMFITQTGDGSVPNVNADPGNATDPVIFEPPALLATSGSPEIWIGTAGTPNLWGGCEVWVSTDGGSSYAQVGTIRLPARYGTGSLYYGADPDTTHTLAADMSLSHGTLASVDSNARDAYASACLIGDEIISYQTATLTSANHYNLTNLRRGGYGSAIGNHLGGSYFMRLDDAVFKMPYDASLKGKTLKVKLVSFNVWGGGRQDISGLSAYSFTPTGVSYPRPSGVTISISDTIPT